MDLTPEQKQMKEKFVIALIEATLPLQKSTDREVTLGVLIQAAQSLKEQLEHELAELREESD